MRPPACASISTAAPIAEELTRASGDPRVVWIAPVGGTTLSADPIAVLKGAPNIRKSRRPSSNSASAREAQMLWFGKPGTPRRAEERALHRTPIRRDIYTPENLANSTMPDADPYEDPGKLHLSARAHRRLVQHAAPTREGHVHRLPRGNEIRLARPHARPACLRTRSPCFSDVSIMPYAIGRQGRSASSTAATPSKPPTTPPHRRVVPRQLPQGRSDGPRQILHRHHPMKRGPAIFITIIVCVAVRGVLHLSGRDGGEAGLRGNTPDGSHYFTLDFFAAVFQNPIYREGLWNSFALGNRQHAGHPGDRLSAGARRSSL